MHKVMLLKVITNSTSVGKERKKERERKGRERKKGREGKELT